MSSSKRPSKEVKMLDYKGVYAWETSDVAEWMQYNNFNVYIKLFTVEHRIDGRALMMLTEDDLRSPPLSLRVLGDIKHLMLCLKELKSRTTVPPILYLGSGKTDCTYNAASKFQAMSDCSEAFPILGSSDHRSLIIQNDEDLDYQRQISKSLKPEFHKLLISYLYMFVVLMMSAMVVAIVHDRVPDQKRFPPLPDVALDNLPIIPWAFHASEAAAVVLLVILCTMLFFHKHRFIILRRLFALMGTAYMLRSITMLLTSLPVPDTHTQCEPRTPGGIWSKVERAHAIWSGFGMSLTGVQTCGDYMFSGHTVIVTLFNFFITEYTPRRIPLLHTISWVLNLFAIFFVVASHDHYSIDVFVAFYLASRLFLYYHSLANSCILRQPGCTKTRIWFPLFSYLESSVSGTVPNEYEWPPSAILRYVRYRRRLSYHDLK